MKVSCCCVVARASTTSAAALLSQAACSSSTCLQRWVCCAAIKLQHVVSSLHYAPKASHPFDDTRCKKSQYEPRTVTYRARTHTHTPSHGAKDISHEAKDTPSHGAKDISHEAKDIHLTFAMHAPHHTKQHILQKQAEMFSRSNTKHILHSCHACTTLYQMAQRLFARKQEPHARATLHRNLKQSPPRPPTTTYG